MAYPPDLPAKEDLASAHSTDLSPSAITIAFEPVLPVLRVPVPAGSDDDPSKGPFVLAFKDEASWSRAWQNCEKQITSQCEAATMKGCSITASKACRSPWWKAFVPNFNTSTEDREACEEKAMMACLAASRRDGIKFARGVCEEVFGDARIANKLQFADPQGHTNRSTENASTSNHNQVLIENPGSTNFRGRSLTDGADDKHYQSSLGKRMLENGWEGGLVSPKKKSDAIAAGVMDRLKLWLEFVSEAVTKLRKSFKD
ncbi:uncharacterized protein LOC9653506 [Selaginella moellendorffii]|uniref:uncharacterized protein LOC9653506 n=1 Tax=Selaginella moellendorffii TaxID=88036 RepID=UPI000D1C4C3E|nr:uncharacterized protein LOC9653506 [Selaginella moellendorffii]|eukprot:XP_024515423.1 uncharacterized protein LOC9653506 [Selaginella moellendorffii]